MLDFIQVPKDWDEVNIWKEQDPNKIGEALRHWSFIGRNGQRGCYETFELPDLFQPILKCWEDKKYYYRAKEVINPEETFSCFIYDQPKLQEEYFLFGEPYKSILSIEAFKLIIAWEWNGDGTLYFRLIGKGKDIEVINTDCKCNYDWRFINNEEQK